MIAFVCAYTGCGGDQWARATHVLQSAQATEGHSSVLLARHGPCVVAHTMGLEFMIHFSLGFKGTYCAWLNISPAALCTNELGTTYWTRVFMSLVHCAFIHSFVSFSIKTVSYSCPQSAHMIWG